LALLPDTKKQRQLNRIYGSWHDFVMNELKAGKSVTDIAMWFRSHDGIEISAASLYRWLKEKRKAA
jgi:IS30 family transposase